MNLTTLGTSYISEIILCPFVSGFISLSRSSSFSHILACQNFIFLKYVVWLFHILSIHLFVCGLDCFFFNYYTLIIHWVVMNNDVLNTGVQILFKSLLSGLFGYIPSIELLAHTVILWLKFLRNLHTVFYKGHTILHSHQQHMSLWLLFFLPFPFPSSSLPFLPTFFYLNWSLQVTHHWI